MEIVGFVVTFLELFYGKNLIAHLKYAALKWMYIHNLIRFILGLFIFYIDWKALTESNYGFYFSERFLRWKDG